MGVTYLLDTHVFLWLLGDPGQVPVAVKSRLAPPENRLLVSAVSALEVATKVRLGKLEPARHLVDTWRARVDDVRAENLAITTEHALLAGAMPWDHRDPFDRLLVAQSLVENHILVTSDAAIRAFPGIRSLTW